MAKLKLIFLNKPDFKSDIREQIKSIAAALTENLTSQFELITYNPNLHGFKEYKIIDTSIPGAEFVIYLDTFNPSVTKIEHNHRAKLEGSDLKIFLQQLEESGIRNLNSIIASDVLQVAAQVVSSQKVTSYYQASFEQGFVKDIVNLWEASEVQTIRLNGDIMNIPKKISILQMVYSFLRLDKDTPGLESNDKEKIARAKLKLEKLLPSLPSELQNVFVEIIQFIELGYFHTKISTHNKYIEGYKLFILHFSNLVLSKKPLPSVNNIEIDGELFIDFSMRNLRDPSATAEKKREYEAQVKIRYAALLDSRDIIEISTL